MKKKGERLTEREGYTNGESSTGSCAPAMD